MGPILLIPSDISLLRLRLILWRLTLQLGTWWDAGGVFGGVSIGKNRDIILGFSGVCRSKPVTEGIMCLSYLHIIIKNLIRYWDSASRVYNEANCLIIILWCHNKQLEYYYYYEV